MPVGEIEGVLEGVIFDSRRALHDAGVHIGLVQGIGGGGDSIVLSGGYVDDVDNGSEVIYTGQGGRDPNTGAQIANQSLTRGNALLKGHCVNGNPIRVSRGSQLDSPYAPESGYRYDGLYRIDNAWHETGVDGFLVYRFRLEKIELTPPPSRVSNGDIVVPPVGRRVGTVSRIIRNTKISNNVKTMHGYRCQISGVLLETPTGPYAEGCHIQPLGEPHNGPDTEDNILCLSPNMHVLFDAGAISIADDMSLIGMEGKLMLHTDHQIDLVRIRYHREHIFIGG
jgi:putative restriction endonuclease